jgi:pimeloyl-ACP methyl ester carboxylesterase
VSERIDRDLELDGRRLEVVEYAGSTSGRPLVLLHEGLGSVSTWREFPETLRHATGRRVIAFSRFGHGQSDPPPGPRTPAFFHDEPVLVGHSDGASIALVHAGAHPVRGLVLLAPHVVVEEVTLSAIRATRDRFETTDLPARLARHHADPEIAFRNWCDVWLDPAFRSWSLELDAERVTCPVLLIQGADDPYGTLDQLDRIERRVRGSVRRLVVAGGHSPHRDATGTVVREIARFVVEVDELARRPH